jgi:aminoglycoside phosphotransferase (APT) family kinase protein
VSDVIVAPEVRDLRLLASQLAAWIASRLPDAEAVRVENLAYPFGAGQSHETVLFDLSWSQDGRPMTQGCVVRIKPTRHTVYPDDLFDEQYRIMQVLYADGRVRVARPLWLETDPTILGAPFFVMEKVRGRVAVSVPPYAEVGWVAEATPTQRAKMWEAGVRQLAAIQNVPRASLSFLEGPEGARSGLAQEWDKYTRFVRWVSADRRWPPLEAAVERLQQRWPKNQPEGLVWGDARIGNMMFDENFDVTAVVDWEQPSIGGALHDLAWWLYNGEVMHGHPDGTPRLAGIPTRDEIIGLWREVTRVSTDDLDWYEDFTRLKFAVLGVRTAALRGLPPPDEAVMAKRLRL